ncbi:hypothetical protein STRAU_3731 [Streptomyces aurantiacus JA 4570]|uniref:Uncharacterized protein n=1 Tax=Streptomyces aurantiacus JA 4570 TaxID=1286094 RepID=S3ZHW2_9ACTN|nr:hypothetical protein STRAU_3731 [Streptomyces aurantiacus JA 4570]
MIGRANERGRLSLGCRGSRPVAGLVVRRSLVVV